MALHTPTTLCPITPLPTHAPSHLYLTHAHHTSYPPMPIPISCPSMPHHTHYLTHAHHTPISPMPITPPSHPCPSHPLSDPCPITPPSHPCSITLPTLLCPITCPTPPHPIPPLAHPCHIKSSTLTHAPSQLLPTHALPLCSPCSLSPTEKSRFQVGFPHLVLGWSYGINSLHCCPHRGHVTSPVGACGQTPTLNQSGTTEMPDCRDYGLLR